MATLQQMREKLQQLNQRSGKKGNDIWKAKDEHVLRLLPDPKGGDPIVILTFHYELGETVLCPKENFDEDCAVCDFCDALKSWKNPDGNDKPERTRKADFEIFKKIQPKQKAVVRSIERTKEGTLSAEGPKWWSPGFTNVNKLMESCADSEYQESLSLDPTKDEGLRVLFDTKNAYEVKVSLKKKGNEDKKGNTKNVDAVEVSLSLKPRALGAPADVEKLLASCKPIGDVYTKQTSAEVKKIFDKYVGSGAKESAVDNTVNDDQEYAPNNTETQAIGGKSLDEAFKELAE